MSDTAAAPSAPAPSPAGDSVIPDAASNLSAHGKSQPAAAAAPKPEPTGERPRGPDGKFLPVAGEAPAAPPPKPKTWRVGEREVADPEELYAIAAQKDVDRRALEQHAAELRELRALKARLDKDPAAAFQTPEQKKAHALATLREAMEEEALTPEQRQMRDLQRKLEGYEKQQAEAREREENAKREAATQAARVHFKQSITEAMEATQLPMDDALAKRVAAKMLHNVRLGLNYPPAVIARQVKQEWQQETQGALSGLKGKALLDALPFLLERLNEVDDAEVLKKLSPLGEKLRRLNLEALGAAPAAQPAAGQPHLRAVPSPSERWPHTQKPQAEWTPQDWAAEHERRARE